MNREFHLVVSFDELKQLETMQLENNPIEQLHCFFFIFAMHLSAVGVS